jgi:undecaprenyl-diphosphatase
MTGPLGERPPVEPAAERLAQRLEAEPPTRPLLAEVLHELGALDLAVYRAIAATPTPRLDEPLRRISDVATKSKLWLGIAAVMAVVGGPKGRRAALTGTAALGANSVTVNLVGKFSIRRHRPDPASAGVPESRHIPMPSSPSFPSGHAAAGFAFADGVADTLPTFASVLRLVAVVVAYSRVHAGVHYPGDVIVGALIGSSVGEGVAVISRRIDRREQ